MIPRRNSSFSTNSSSGSSAYLLPPVNPKDLIEKANSYEYSTSISAASWIRTATRILKHGQWYAADNVFDEAFILYNRLLDLILNRVYKHPDLKRLKLDYQRNPKSANGLVYKEYLELKHFLPDLMNETEKIKKVLKENYLNYVESENRKKQLIELQEVRFLKLKSQEQEKNELLKKQQQEHQQRDYKFDEENLSKKLRTLSSNSLSSFEVAHPSTVPSYPNLPEFTMYENNGLSTSPQNAMKSQLQAPKLPSLPEPQTTTLSPPAPYYNHLQLPNHNQSLAKQNKTKKDPLHKTVNFTEGGSPLRTIFVSPDLIDNFLKIAKRNTNKKLETCGILCGKLSRNAFFITYLVIPDQDSTQNTCNTKNEEKLFEFIDNLDLFILGWIHTHPTQTCFLSSIDLHTQNSYQIMLNEAIAIVCSPSENLEKKLGIFRLTDPPGIPIVTNCNKPGFHPHNEDNLYVECHRLNNDNPSSGHVVIKGELPYQVKDLRP